MRGGNLGERHETRDYRAVNLVFNAEYPMVRWLEANGYDVTYFIEDEPPM